MDDRVAIALWRCLSELFCTANASAVAPATEAGDAVARGLHGESSDSLALRTSARSSLRLANQRSNAMLVALPGLGPTRTCAIQPIAAVSTESWRLGMIGRDCRATWIALEAVAMPTVSRRQLYSDVWATPMRLLAPKYGISDVGLTKICRKHGIPTPPRGYWAKREAGQSPDQKALPSAENDDPIRIPDPSVKSLRDPALQSELEDHLAAATSPEAKISIAQTLRSAHDLVRAANDQLSQAEKDPRGLLVPPERCPLRIFVSAGQLRRALLIVDALLKAAELRGYAVQPGPSIVCFGQKVGFTVEETVAAVREREDVDLAAPYRFGHSRFNEKRVPSGDLSLKLAESDDFWARGLRKSWKDGERKRLEENLNSVLAGIVAFGARKCEHDADEKRRRLAEADAARRREAEARERAERRKLQVGERARVDALLRQADDWRQAETLRQFVEAVRADRVDAGCTIEQGSELDRWIEWALAQADRLDPLVESPPSILDESIPEDPRRW